MITMSNETPPMENKIKGGMAKVAQVVPAVFALFAFVGAFFGDMKIQLTGRIGKLLDARKVAAKFKIQSPNIISWLSLGFTMCGLLTVGAFAVWIWSMPWLPAKILGSILTGIVGGMIASALLTLLME